MTRSSPATDIFYRLLTPLFPPACLDCRKVEGSRSLPLGLCCRCRGRLESAKANDYGLSWQASSSLPEVVCAWLYQSPCDAVIHALKFGRLEFLGRDLADGLHSLLEDRVQELDVIVPIPLHWLRLRARGFNQAEAIARPLARSLGLPLVRALTRRRRTTAQTRLGRAPRMANLRLAFAPTRRPCRRIVDCRVLLVDDVITTGATLEAAARCLLADAGATSVLGATAAATPLPVPDPLRRSPLTGAI